MIKTTLIAPPVFPGPLGNVPSTNKAPRQDIMVDGLCPKNSVSSSEPMFDNAAYRPGRESGFNSGDYPD
jgi:hypothetical protein